MLKETGRTLRHPNCGTHYPVYQTRKGNYMWRCYICGEVMFLPHPDIYNCPHEIGWRRTRDGNYETRFCPVCRIREFRPVNWDSIRQQSRKQAKKRTSKSKSNVEWLPPIYGP